MVGLVLLKQLENLSDENVVLQWKRNPYYQYFCGYDQYQAGYPCHSTDLVYFRNRIGKEGMELIFDMSVKLHGEDAEEDEVIIDTTVQENNITYPTDGKLAIKIINKLLKIAKKEKIKLRRTYLKEIKQLRIQLRFFRHPKKIKKARGAMKRLRTIAKTLLRDIDRKFGDDLSLHEKYGEDFYLFMKVLLQERNSKNKIYSLHEADAYAVNKGKDNKGYEYGTKASVVSTKTHGIIVGVSAHKENTHDSKTLFDALDNAHTHRTKPIEEAICDRGYRGVKEVSNFNYAHFAMLVTAYFLMILKYKIISEHILQQIPLLYSTRIEIPGKELKRDTKQQKEIKRKKFRRRAAIEPIIGHLKSDYRLSRNYLKGFKGDEINLLLAATAWNLKKWINIYFFALFIKNNMLQIKAIEKIIVHKLWISRLLKLN